MKIHTGTLLGSTCSLKNTNSIIAVSVSTYTVVGNLRLVPRQEVERQLIQKNKENRNQQNNNGTTRSSRHIPRPDKEITAFAPSLSRRLVEGKESPLQQQRYSGPIAGRQIQNQNQNENQDDIKKDKQEMMMRRPRRRNSNEHTGLSSSPRRLTPRRPLNLNRSTNTTTNVNANHRQNQQRRNIVNAGPYTGSPPHLTLRSGKPKHRRSRETSGSTPRSSPTNQSTVNHQQRNIVNAVHFGHCQNVKRNIVLK
jgi:hypothetical protein